MTQPHIHLLRPSDCLNETFMRTHSSAQIEWEFSTDYQREHPLVKQLGTALRMTSADMDLAWQQAAGL
jgi:hypothetical protein